MRVWSPVACNLTFVLLIKRGRTSTIPRLPGGHESARISGGKLVQGYGGPQGGQQGGQQGGHDGRLGEDGSIVNGGGGEETERSTSTVLTSAGWSKNKTTLWFDAIFISISKLHGPKTLPLEILMMSLYAKESISCWQPYLQERQQTDIPMQAVRLGGWERQIRSTRKDESRKPTTRIWSYCRKSKMSNPLGQWWPPLPIDWLMVKARQ